MRKIVWASVGLIALSLIMIPVLAKDRQALASKLLDAYEAVKGYLLSVKDRDANLSAAVDEALSKADPLVEEAKSMMNSGDYEGAVQKLREALAILRNVLKQFKEPLKDDIRAMNALKRLSYWLHRMDVLVKRLSKYVNVTSVQGELDTVDSLIQEAKDLISSGNIQEALFKVDEARNLLRKAYQDLKSLMKESNLTKRLRSLKKVLRASKACISKLNWLERELVKRNITAEAEEVRKLKWNVMDQVKDLRSKLRDGNLTREDVQALVSLLKECKGTLNEYRGYLSRG